MKTLTLVLSVLIATVLAVGGPLLLVVAAPPAEAWTIILATVGMSFLVYGPLALGSLLAFWDLYRDHGSRRLRRRWLLTVGLTEVAGVASVVAYAVVNGASAWLPAVVAAAGAVLTAGALFVGPALLRRDLATRPELPEWMPLTPAQIRRKIVTVAATFAAFLVLGTVTIVLVAVAAGMSTGDLGGVVVVALALAFLAAGAASVIVTLSLNRALRESAGGDLTLLRKVSKVVLRGQELDPDADAGERIAATRFAQVSSVVLPFQFAYIVLLYAGIATQQLQQLTAGDSPYALALLIGLVVVLAVIVPLMTKKITRVRRWLRSDAVAARPDAVSAGRS